MDTIVFGPERLDVTGAQVSDVSSSFLAAGTPEPASPPRPASPQSPRYHRSLLVRGSGFILTLVGNVQVGYQGSRE